MYLSRLQKFILLKCYYSKGKRASRQKLVGFYRGKRKPKNLQRVLSRSLERLINKGMLIGYGVRTPQKWYIKDIKLTPKGRKYIKKVLGEQQKLI